MSTLIMMGRAKERAKSLLFEPGQTLPQRVVRGGFWAFALRITNRLFQLIRTFALAMFLSSLLNPRPSGGSRTRCLIRWWCDPGIGRVRRGDFMADDLDG